MNKKILFFLVNWLILFQKNAWTILHNEVLQEDSTPTDVPFVESQLSTSSSTEKTPPTSQTTTQASDPANDQAEPKTQTSFVQGYMVNKAEMQSFEEWKEMKLKDPSLNKANIPTKSESKEVKNEILKRRKNYAGLDCGAKIVEKNQEASNPSHILTESKDDYMLNSCSSKVWFIIELCEPVKIKEIQMANYELFSNVPRQFKVFASDRFVQSGGSNNWPSKYFIGTFEANNTRNLQTFGQKDSLEFRTDEKMVEIYAKYVKFEMLSHYGNEHYCPLSVVRIYGTSLNDDEETDVDEIEPSVDEPGKDDTKIDKTTIFDSTSVLLTNLISVVVGKGFSFFSKLTNLNVSKPSKSTLLISDNESYLAPGKTSIDRNSILGTDMHRILCFTSSIGLRNCCQCFDQSEKLHRHLENSSFNFYSSSKFCGYFYTMTTIVQSRSNSSLLSKYLSNIKPSKNQTVIQKIHKNITQFSLNNIYYYISNEWLDNQTFYSFPEKKTTKNSRTEPGTIVQSDKNEMVKSHNETESAVKKVGEKKPESQSDSIAQIEKTINDTMHKFESLNMSNRSEEVIASPVVPSVNGKDALSARLDYRIKMLELNMSLSSQYLEKLSQHYRKQMDEMQKAFNLTTSALIDTIRVADQRDIKQNEKIFFIEKKIEKMEQNLNEINKFISGVKIQAYLIIWTAVLVLASVVLIELKRCVGKKRHRYLIKEASGDNRKNVNNLEELIEAKCKELMAKQEQKFNDQLESIENYYKSNKFDSQNLEAETIKGVTHQSVAAARVVSSTIAVVAAVSLAASNAQFNTVNQNNEI
ncbi:SUN domain-containing ossification factor isoform X3 [Brachionus plicatilis]|uniref:SUN domain-containing ossification factor isoform X3 n=1 Tax=Brachionus plicatilis TaxID=10195 RepID=A0A3M7S2E1_BRAPC|nr:SUN domain-containing ossification factor isoform X3 [Brachionus plicatilis]